MRFDTEAIVCAVRGHGEHGTVLRALTPAHGIVAAYVRGGRGRRMRPVLIPGNLVSARLRARSDSQLPQAEVELARSRAPLFGEPLPAGAIEWTTSLVTAALPERQPYPHVYEALAGLLDAVEAAPSARGWGAALARFELLLLAELGYGRPPQSLPGALSGSAPDWAAILKALDGSGIALLRELPTQRVQSLHATRLRLIERMRKAAA